MSSGASATALQHDGARRRVIVLGCAASFLMTFLLRRYRSQKGGDDKGKGLVRTTSERTFRRHPANSPTVPGGRTAIGGQHPGTAAEAAGGGGPLTASKGLNGTLDFSHPDGPNIGPASDPGWLENHDHQNVPAKTDLLHTGHLKGGKLLICVIGLPARGKTYIARKVARYLRWINYRTRVFCLARYRQDKYGHKQAAEFFDTANTEFTESRMELLACALEDSVGYLNRGGEVAILDGTNVTEARRNLIRERLGREDGYEILWIESICEDPQVIAHNVAQLRDASPDYVADHDFERRIAFYKKDYVHVGEEEGSYAKVFDAGRKLELNNIHGFLPTKVISFLMNLHIMPRPVYFTRHGESIFNIHGLIGGDSSLSPKGEKFADLLSLFISNEPELPPDKLNVWTSTMKRARHTAQKIKCARYVEWRSLREIEVGVCDGLSYDQIKDNFPNEYKNREQDKLRYRYPRGESYMDIISRLESVIFELERQQAPVVIVAHQAVLRCLYAYFLDLPPEEVPYLAIPLHTVIKVTPKAYGCAEKRYKMMV